MYFFKRKIKFNLIITEVSAFLAQVIKYTEKFLIRTEVCNGNNNNGRTVWM
jgi:hypothetical protein